MAAKTKPLRLIDWSTEKIYTCNMSTYNHVSAVKEWILKILWWKTVRSGQLVDPIGQSIPVGVFHEYISLFYDQFAFAMLKTLAETFTLQLFLKSLKLLFHKQFFWIKCFL